MAQLPHSESDSLTHEGENGDRNRGRAAGASNDPHHPYRRV